MRNIICHTHLKKEKSIGILIIFFLCCFFLFLFITPGFSETFTLTGKKYVLPDNSDYVIRDGELVPNTFFYGSKTLGTLMINDIVKTTEKNEYEACGITKDVSVYCVYDGRYKRTNPDRWYVDGDGTGKVNGTGLGLFQGVGNGCILIEKSSDGHTWEPAIEPIKNYFSKEKKNKDAVIYTIAESEVKHGMYYHILIAYRFTRRTSTSFPQSYTHKKCIEDYYFYVSSEKGYATMVDLSNGSLLPSDSEVTCSSGFQIRKNGGSEKVTVRKDSQEKKEYGDFAYFSEPGEYLVTIKTDLGTVRKQTVSVTEGLEFTILGNPQISKSDRNKGFIAKNNVVRTTDFGKALTSVSLAMPNGSSVKKGTGKDGDKYGIKGQNLSIFLTLNMNPDALAGDWVINYDEWGKRENQRVNDIVTGEVGKGALIIQTSSDGKNWARAGKYAQGLYSTDFASHYGKGQSVLIYTPSGQSIISGTYIRIFFAYQIYNTKTKKYADYIERHQFYLCSDELNAVTFHNLSVADSLLERFEDMDENLVEAYSDAESLRNGSYTTSGFTIDMKLNPTVDYSVFFNGTKLSKKQEAYDETGKYDIFLRSAVQSLKDLTIYVDRSTPEEAMELYFGEGFISGKRIFTEDSYPQYEAGKTNYHLNAIDSEHIPLCGYIQNLSTGEVIIVEQTPEEKNGIITEAGNYKAVLTTAQEYFSGNYGGDARVFTFQFTVIPPGTAPGPQINQKMLDVYAGSAVTDSRPIYYGLTYSSAGKGNITLAFATKEAAIEYAYQYEKGTVEKQADGTYRYNGSFIISGQKTKYESAWDLADAINYFAEAAVHESYFDMSDQFTYLTLTEETLQGTPNLRQLELSNSVTIFAEGQKEQLTQIEALPIINDKVYAYLNVETGKIVEDKQEFEFIQDYLGGIDSGTVQIIDCNGKEYPVRYEESVGKQLKKANCPSGIITVHEETKFGDANEYQAVYIAPGENPTELIISYIRKGKKELEVVDRSRSNITITADAFRIVASNYATDPYAFIKVASEGNEELFLAKDEIEKIWNKPATYQITCRNRLGYGYSFTIEVTGNGAAQNENDQNAGQSEKQKEVNQLTVESSEELVEKAHSLGETRKDQGNGILIPLLTVVGLLILLAVVIIVLRKNNKGKGSEKND